MCNRYWVVGGEFRSVGFDELIAGTERVLGPFAERNAAEQAWRYISEEHRPECNVRFAVLQEPRREITATA